MRRLKDLSVKELSDLLMVPINKAKKFLDAAESTPFMQVPVDEVQDDILRFRDDGTLESELRDKASRYMQLQELLFREPEFETRYPAAYALLLERHYPEITDELSGLHLPSFDVRVLRQAPERHLRRSGELDGHKDAFSATRGKMEGRTPLADQDYEYLDAGYLRGLLLEILRREEYWERLHPRYRDPDLLVRYSAPGRTPIRLTDLRLATALDPDDLKRSLIRPLRLLERPVSSESVVRWKRLVLDRGADLSEQGFKEDEVGIVVISFAAAALLLFLDLDMPGVRDGKSSLLDAKVWSLARVVKDLAQSLNEGADELEKLLAGRKPGNQTALERKYYDALSHYRIRGSLREAAEHLGINPYDKVTGRGTKSWKKRTREKLIKAEELEKKRHPRAASIFANRDNEHIRRKALRAHELFLEGIFSDFATPTPPVPRDRWDWWGRNLGKQLRVNTRTRRGREITKAYVDLGWSIRDNVPPLS
ncbi:MAG: hypothetical protein M3R38_04540 [Actinomycetota bacterium]|nr:hypothetical protein [Actinomycetota bacterium]